MSGNQLELWHALAVDIASDYPGIRDAEPPDQRWAVLTSYRGLRLANEDLHGLVRELADELGWSADDLREWVCKRHDWRMQAGFAARHSATEALRGGEG